MMCFLRGGFDRIFCFYLDIRVFTVLGQAIMTLFYISTLMGRWYMELFLCTLYCVY